MARTTDRFAGDERIGAFVPASRSPGGHFQSPVGPGLSLHPDELFNKPRMDAVTLLQTIELRL